MLFNAKMCCVVKFLIFLLDFYVKVFVCSRFFTQWSCTLTALTQRVAHILHRPTTTVNIIDETVGYSEARPRSSAVDRSDPLKSKSNLSSIDDSFEDCSRTSITRLSRACFVCFFFDSGFVLY